MFAERINILSCLGIVVSKQANFFNVELLDEQQSLKDQNTITNSKPLNRFLCTARSRLKHFGDSIYVGDFVLLEEICCRNMTAVVNEVCSRKSWLKRPAVANVSNIIVVLAHKEPVFDFTQASRFLLTAENTGLSVDFLLTKMDLVSTDEMNKQLARIDSWGYRPFSVSVKTGEGLKRLKEHIFRKSLSVVFGPSGVGKSSLLNKLIPGTDLKVGTLSEKISRGKNTTRHVELFSLSSNSRVADTPGFNRPEIFVEPSKIAALFPEIRSQLKDYPCRFRNCLHLDELGCGLNKNWERYSFYRNFVQEMFSLSFPGQAS
nr:ribosome small subunit-dependent GTPase A [Prochlorococcus sp. MIT 1341]